MTTRNARETEIRKRAEEMERRRRNATPDQGVSAETQALIHELRVHQIELEMQNDELLQTQGALDAARAEYFDLYDLAPVGYCTLSSAGYILKANFTLATLLGSTRAFLISQPFTRFILTEDQDLFYLHRKKAIEAAEPVECDLRMVTTGGASFWAHLSAVTAPGLDGLPILRMTLADVSDRKQAEVALRESLQEQERLLKEVHHRVKNNLQVISSLLRLEAGRSAEASTRNSLKEMQGRVLSMALLHETLYRTGVFGRIELSEYLKLLATQLVRGQNLSSADVRLVLDLAPTTMLVDHAIPCGLIVNELLTNSLKHGFADGRAGEVRVALEHQPGGSVRLQVSDTGVGLPADMDRKRGQSLGLQLVSDLARQLGGALEIGPSPAAVFAVTFPFTRPETS